MIREKVVDDIVNDIISNFRQILYRGNASEERAKSVKDIIFQINTEYNTKVKYELEKLKEYMTDAIDNEPVGSNWDAYMKNFVAQKVDGYTIKMLNPSMLAENYMYNLVDMLKKSAKEEQVLT